MMPFFKEFSRIPLKNHTNLAIALKVLLLNTCDILRDLLRDFSLKKPNLNNLGIQRILLEVWERRKMVTFVSNENFK